MFVRLLLWILLGFVVYTGYQAVKRVLNAPKPKPPEKTSRGEEMVKDPQCGTYLPRSDAHSAQINGQTCYFCSEKCRTAYQDRQRS